MALLLTPVPGTFSDIDGPSGQQLTLKTKEHIGLVLLASVTYAGAELVPAGSAVDQVSLTIAPGQNTVKMVAVFSASTGGRGELREDAGADSQFLIDLPGNDPFQVMRINGTRPRAAGRASRAVATASRRARKQPRHPRKGPRGGGAS